MDINYDVFNGVFWTFFITSIIGLTLKIVSACYKSKCKSVDLCGLKIIRDVEVEEKFDEFIKIHMDEEKSTQI